MKQNIWEFLKKPDGTYAVYHNDNLLSDSIPEMRRMKRFAYAMDFADTSTKLFGGNWVIAAGVPST